MNHLCRVFGHRFKPRYDISAPKWMDRLTEIKGGNVAKLYEKTYVCDVCIRCGKVTNKEEKE